MSQILSTHLLPNFYPPAPIHIGDTRLTPREWDVLSAFYFLKKPQAIGTLLSLGNKGVETHLRNIKQKLPLRRKDLTHFLDTCSVVIKESLAKHYKYLLIEDAFQETLKTLKAKRPKQIVSYQWDKSESFPTNFPFVYIHNHLKLAGLHVVNNNEQVAEDNQEHEIKTLPRNIINISDPASYYTSFINFLQSLFPEDKYKEVFQEFLKKQHDILSGKKNITPSSDPNDPVDSKQESQLPNPSAALYETIKAFLSAPQYRNYRYIGGIGISFLISLFIKLWILPHSADQSSQNVKGDGNVAIQGDANTVSSHHQSSAVNARDIQKVILSYSHSKPTTKLNVKNVLKNKPSSTWNLPLFSDYYIDRHELKNKIWMYFLAKKKSIK